MEQPHRFADSSTLRMALIARTVEDPFPKWDADSGAWVVQARPRNGGADWVLARGQRPTAFAEQQAAWEAANWLRVAAPPYLIGLR